MAPDWEKLNCHPTAIVMLDGFISDEARAAAKKRFPQARIIEVTDMVSYHAAAAQRLLCSDDELRSLYRVLRQREKMEYTMNMLAEETGLSESQVLFALSVFSELKLLEFTMQPLRYRIIPSGKVSLESSRLRARLMRMRG